MESSSLVKLRKQEEKLLAQLELVRQMIAEEIGEDRAEKIEDVNPSPTLYKPPKRKVLTPKSITEKFLFVLKQKQRFMKVREIAQELVKMEGGDEDDWVFKLSRRTRKLKSVGKIDKYMVGKSRTNVFWGSPNWLENGEIKEEYMYDDKAISERGSSSLDDYEL